MTRSILFAAAGLAVAGAALAQTTEFGTEEDQAYAEMLWSTMIENDLAGEGAVMAYPYPGTDPHGMMLETFYDRVTVDGQEGTLIVKRNYGPEGVTAEEVLSNPSEYLGAVTVMFQREEGYDPDRGNWFWAKYLPDGTFDTDPAGVALVGVPTGCVNCHQNADGEDYVFAADDVAMAR